MAADRGTAGGRERSGEPADSSSVHPQGDLAADLRTLVGLRSRTSVRDRHLPALLSHLKPEDARDPDRRLGALLQLIDDSIAEMDDPVHRQAAQALLGSGDQRWDSLKVRGNQAAAMFGCGWDAYRRRRTSAGTSQLTDTLEALARSITSRSGRSGGPAAPATPAVPLVRITDDATDTFGTAPEPRAPDHAPVLELESPQPLSHAEALSAHGRRRNGILMASVALIGLLAVSVAGVALLRRDDGTDAAVRETKPPVTCGVLRYRPGDVAPHASEDLRSLSDDFRRAAQRADPPILCAGLMEMRGELVTQPVWTEAGTGTAALASATPSDRAGSGSPAVVLLDHGEYTQVRRATAEGATENLGAPVARRDTSSHLVVEFTAGVLASERIGGPTVRMNGVVLEQWREGGGMDGPMGPPVANRYEEAGVGRIHEFASGRAIVDYVTGDLRWETVLNPGDLLPPHYLGAVLETPDRASWLVDLDGVRHWIPDNRSHACATRAQAAPLVTDVPAVAIATLPLGEPFLCQ